MRPIGLLLGVGFLIIMTTSAKDSGKYLNRDVWRLENRVLRVSVTQVGGHIAELVLKGEGEVNPLWQQARPTIDPTEFDPKKHSELYGSGSGARLMSGLLGHNLCFPYWGDPSEPEFRAGMTYHGETGIVRWTKVSEQSRSEEMSLTLSAELPESRTRFVRTLSLLKGHPVVYFDERAENLTSLDRPVGWCEHVTVGPPFLEKAVTVFDASLTVGRMLGDASGASVQWPEGRAEKVINLRTVRDIPQSGFVNNFLVDPTREFGYFTAVNPKMNLLLGYLFRRQDFRWLNVWEANIPASANQPPMLTRGLEFSNTPTHGSLKALVKVESLFDTPAFEWLDARSSLSKKFCAFTARTPDGFLGVQQIQIKDDALEIVEKDRGRTVRVSFDRARLR
ncbi:MAG: hypothetical protein AB1898_07485 [Acidobacteriota bacterium]